MGVRLHQRATCAEQGRTTKERMSAQDTSPDAGFGVPVTPLLPEDPPRIGDYWLDGVHHRRVSGAAYLAHGDGAPHLTRDTVAESGAYVLLVQLSRGAAGDKAARDRFSGLVNAMHIDDVAARGGHEQDQGRLGRKFRPETDDPVHPDDDVPLAPWVALALDGPGERIPEAAVGLLTEVDLTLTEQHGTPSGPDFRLHWAEMGRPGLNRVWPLPWPGRYDRAGWMSILVSWLLMMLLATLFVLLAVWVFHDEPPQSPPPQGGQGSGTSTSSSTASSSSSSSASPSPQSGSPSPQSGSPSPQSASPTPTSGSPTPESSGRPNGGSPTPPSKM
ncbi:hypothetical protein GCM10027418_19100 [Mariniluteicoccus endophyticus]